MIGDFSGGFLSSDGGGTLLAQLDRSIGLTRGLAECFIDHRDQRFVEHSAEQLVAQRVHALVHGYEDLNDHASLRLDPLMAMVAGKKDPLGQDRRHEADKGKALAAPATLQRLESAVDHPGSRYHRIGASIEKMRAYLLRAAVRTLDKASAQVIIDLDATDARLHGHQEGRFFHGYYGDYCYLPLLVYIGSLPVWAQLRSADKEAADGSVAALEPIVAAIRARCPKAKIIVRGDSGFCREVLLAWCEQNAVYYCLGMARNARLQEALTPTMTRARERAVLCGGHTREFTEFSYRTLDSWSRERRVIGKAEILGDKDNPRFVVTNLNAEDFAPDFLYEKLYCARGQMENAIKEHQLDLFGERLSCAGFAANEVRLLLASFAHLLIERFRAIGLKGTELANATAGTIRLQLLKIAAVVEVSVRRIHIRFCSACPRRDLFALVHRNLLAWSGTD